MENKIPGDWTLILRNDGSRPSVYDKETLDFAPWIPQWEGDGYTFISIDIYVRPEAEVRHVEFQPNKEGTDAA